MHYLLPEPLDRSALRSYCVELNPGLVGTLESDLVLQLAELAVGVCHANCEC